VGEKAVHPLLLDGMSRQTTTAYYYLNIKSCICHGKYPDPMLIPNTRFGCLSVCRKLSFIHPIHQGGGRLPYSFLPSLFFTFAFRGVLKLMGGGQKFREVIFFSSSILVLEKPVVWVT